MYQDTDWVAYYFPIHLSFQLLSVFYKFSEQQSETNTGRKCSDHGSASIAQLEKLALIDSVLKDCSLLYVPGFAVLLQEE